MFDSNMNMYDLEEEMREAFKEKNETKALDILDRIKERFLGISRYEAYRNSYRFLHERMKQPAKGMVLFFLGILLVISLTIVLAYIIKEMFTWKLIPVIIFYVLLLVRFREDWVRSFSDNFETWRAYRYFRKLLLEQATVDTKEEPQIFLLLKNPNK